MTVGDGRRIRSASDHSETPARGSRWPLGRLLVGLLVTLPLLVGSWQLLVPAQAGAAGTPLHPDLKILPARELRFDRTDVSYNLDGLATSMHNVLRFSSTVYNVGVGALQVRAHIDSASESGTAFQRVFNSDGTYAEYPVGQLYYHAAHNHYHYDAWGEYQLWTKANYDAWIASGRTIPEVFLPGAKATACIMDEEFIVDVPGTIASQTYNGGNCFPDSNNNIVEGLSIGWGDTYDYYRPSQWFDLGQNGTLADGMYVVRMIADPTNALYESVGKADGTVEGSLSNESTRTLVIAGGQILDSDPPLGTVTINNVNTSTNSANVTVRVIGRDDVSDIDKFRVSNDGTLWAEFPYTTTGSFATSVSWNLTNATYGGTAASGLKTVYVQFHDASGKWGPNQTDTITLGTPPPPPTTSPYALAVLADGPTGYWRLDETSGTAAADASGGGQAATYVGSPTLGVAGLLPAAEAANKAVTLDGSTQYATVPSSATLSPTAAISLEAWLKPASLPTAGNFKSILSKPGAYALQFNGPLLEFTLVQGSTSQRLQAPAGAVVAGQTYHVVGAWDGATQRLYINGALATSQPLSGAISANTTQISIGSWGTTEVLAGTIDEPAVYGAPLSAARVSAHYIAGAGDASTPPTAPSALIATTQFDTIINLSWTDNAANETGYVLERDLAADFSAPFIANLAADTTSYSSTGLTAGTKYYYRVKAMRGAISSTYSNTAFATTSGGIGPAAPTGLTATPQSTTAIALAWADNSIDESNFVVERDSTPAFAAPVVVTLPPNTVAYTSSALTPATTYYYRVKGTNPSGSSPYTSTVNATTQATGPAGYALAVMTDSPSGYWRLGELSGTTAASQTGSNNGTYLNGTLLNQPSLLAGDAVNKAVTFDGTNDSVSIPNSAALSPTTAVTVEAWIKPTAIPAVGGWASVVSKANAYSLQFNGPQLEFTIIQGSTRQRLKAPVGAIAVGQTYYVAGSYDGTTQRLYINFAQVAAQPLTGPISASTNALTIGSWGAGEYFKGSIDEPAVFPYELSPARLAAHHSAGSGLASGVAPAAPSGLIATPSSSAAITLAWTDNANNETGFVLERAPTNTFADITTIPVVADATSFPDAGLTASTQYFYRIRATNASGDSLNSNVANATTQAAPIPAAPTTLVATAQSSSSIGLTWADNSTDETGFVIERAPTNTFALVTTLPVGAGVTSYTNTGLTAGTGYFYRVKAVNGGASSTYSNTATATTLPAPAPAAPTGLVATAQSSTAIGLTWTDNATDETGYVVERAADATFTTPVSVSLAANTTSYSSTSLNPATTYYYRVRAVNGPTPSTNSNTANATTLSAPTPAAPTSLVATAQSSTVIVLSWTDNASNETGYVVERAADVAFTAPVSAALAANAVSYSSTGLTPATTYYYRVRATGSSGDSGNSNAANAATMAAGPSAPSSLVATAQSSTIINLTWTDTSNSETGFVIERAPTNAFTSITTATVTANVSVYSSTGLAPGTTYYYRVRATNGSGDSANSNTANATTTAAVPATPTLLAATAQSNTQINLTWVDNATNETSYVLEQALTNAFSSVTAISLGANTTSYSNIGLAAGTTYYYRVRALNGATPSANSGTASATTTGAAACTATVTSDSDTNLNGGGIVTISWTNGPAVTQVRVEFRQNGNWVRRLTWVSGATTYAGGDGGDDPTWRLVPRCGGVDYPGVAFDPS